MRDPLRFTPPATRCRCRACRATRILYAVLVGVVVGGLAGVLVLSL